MNAMTQTRPVTKIVIRTATAVQKAKGFVYWHDYTNGFIDMVKHLQEGAQDQNWVFSEEDVELFRSLLKAAAQGKVDDFVDLLPDGVFAVRFPEFISERPEFRPFADALVAAGIGWGTVDSGSLQDASTMLSSSDQSKQLMLTKPKTPKLPQGRDGICYVNFGGLMAMPAVAAAAARDDLQLDDPALWAKVRKDLEFLLISSRGNDVTKKAAATTFVTTLHDAGIVRIILPYKEEWWQFKAVSSVLKQYAPAWLTVLANQRTYDISPPNQQSLDGAEKRRLAEAKKKARAAQDAETRLAMRGKSGQQGVGANKQNKKGKK